MDWEVSEDPCVNNLSSPISVCPVGQEGWGPLKLPWYLTGVLPNWLSHPHHDPLPLPGHVR